MLACQNGHLDVVKELMLNTSVEVNAKATDVSTIAYHCHFHLRVQE